MVRDSRWTRHAARRPTHVPRVGTCRPVHSPDAWHKRRKGRPLDFQRSARQCCRASSRLLGWSKSRGRPHHALGAQRRLHQVGNRHGAHKRGLGERTCEAGGIPASMSGRRGGTAGGCGRGQAADAQAVCTPRDEESAAGGQAGRSACGIGGQAPATLPLLTRRAFSPFSSVAPCCSTDCVKLLGMACTEDSSDRCVSQAARRRYRHWQQAAGQEGGGRGSSGKRAAVCLQADWDARWSALSKRCTARPLAGRPDRLIEPSGGVGTPASLPSTAHHFGRSCSGKLDDGGAQSGVLQLGRAALVKPSTHAGQG